MSMQHNPLLENTADQLRIDIYNTGYGELPAGYPSHDYAGTMCFLFIVEEGEGELVAGGQSLPFQPGYAYLIPPGSSWRIHYHTNLRKFFMNLNIFTPDGENMLADSTTTLMLPFAKEQLSVMLEQYFSEKTEQLFFVKSTLYTLLTDFLRANQAETAAPVYHPAVQTTIRYIQKHLSLQLTTQQLAEHCGVSASFLSARFKKDVGIPLGKYIRFRIICQARLELEQQTLSVAEISKKLGFCDQFYFSRFFKSSCGETPTQYRRHYATLSYNIGTEE
ncbi:MAG: helix-turn-helix transcriptional regulator [Clostridia bacterium]|nr:helix-turn-helix transcriptional regulator [Clostridia bacterium]